RVVLAHADRAALDLEPALGRTSAGQHQVHDGALLRQLRPDRLPVQAPHDRQAVAILVGGVTEDPLGGPAPERPDDGGHGCPWGGERIAPRPPSGPSLAADEPMPLKQPEPLREYGPADPGNPPVDLVEADGAHHQLADDQRRPPVTQHGHPDRDRAVVRIALHKLMMPGLPIPWVVRIRYPAARCLPRLIGCWRPACTLVR